MMTPIVIKSWTTNAQPAGQESYVDISGRAGGLIAWLLNLLEISPTVRMTVRHDKIVFEQGSLEGTGHFITPLENICSTFFRYKRPLKEAFIGGCLIGVVTFFLFAIPGIVFAVLYYFLNKTLTIGFTDIGGHTREIPFKRSLMEGKNIDESEAARVCALIQHVVDLRRNRPFAIAA